MFSKTLRTQVDNGVLVGHELFSFEVLGHTDHEIYNRKCHKHDLKVLVAEQSNEKLKQSLGFLENSIWVNLNTALYGYVNFIDG